MVYAISMRFIYGGDELPGELKQTRHQRHVQRCPVTPLVSCKLVQHVSVEHREQRKVLVVGSEAVCAAHVAMITAQCFQSVLFFESAWPGCSPRPDASPRPQVDGRIQGRRLGACDGGWARGVRDKGKACPSGRRSPHGERAPQTVLTFESLFMARHVPSVWAAPPVSTFCS